ncbi:hypothetical protein H072_4671 [Dactylellina haptotyla CBS 200.50]|uniref:F-box domain-containing protein n=1 Tax=Dactylellina haptotyla (strain CBS 200.50) TaxID=1284197 RepID=S8AEU9_DACHA|nr:hypothetical protein H072_4671 [Dactylellina haptotyla CBS 200.50]
MEDATLIVSPIMALPVELHLRILSHLPVHNQVFASMTCVLWRDIILQTRSLLVQRYVLDVKDGSRYEMVHRLMHRGRNIVCTVKDGLILENKLSIIDRDDGYVHSPLVANLQASEMEISNCKILDEKIFTAPDGPGRPFKNIVEIWIWVWYKTYRGNTIFHSNRWSVHTGPSTTVREFLGIAGGCTHTALTNAKGILKDMHLMGYQYEPGVPYEIGFSYHGGRAQHDPGHLTIRVYLDPKTNRKTSTGNVDVRVVD